MRKTLTIFFSIYLVLAGLIPAQAQTKTSSHASLYDLQTTTFPSVTAGLDVYDSADNFVTGLSSDSITIFEDNQPRPLANLEELQPGADFAVALDPGPYFAYRDANAITRYEKVIRVLKAWAATHPDSLGDDLSFIPTGGTISTHMTTTAAFSEALAAYQPNLLGITSSPETLSRSLDVVSETPSQPGMKPVVLYITSLPTADTIPELDNLTQRAVDQNIRVNVWIVSSTAFFSTTGATALKDLAIRTSGQFVLFSGQEPLPSLEMYLAPIRHTYRLTYSSGILSSGGHTLSAQVNLSDGTVTSSPLSFDLNIQPPNPILVSPPAQIVRKAPDLGTTSIKSFIPTLQPISIIIEFPDGRTRPLVRTTLYADGQKVAENTTNPFDRFIWDLSRYTVSGQHVLTVEAVDSFGLSRVSLGVPVMVTIVRPQVGLLPFLSRNSQWVALAAILFAGLGVGMTLVWSRRKKLHPGKSGKKGHRDPLRQSIRGNEPRSGMRLPWKRPERLSEAYLVRLKDDGQPMTSPSIPIRTPEMTFGSDPIQATRILDDPSVSALHARLRVENGKYILTDEKSAAGTWVNYEQLTAPRRLQHGDILHIGRVSYRFMLRTAPERAAPRVTPIKK
jgi:hypothetical protein